MDNGKIEKHYEEFSEIAVSLAALSKRCTKLGILNDLDIANLEVIKAKVIGVTGFLNTKRISESRDELITRKIYADEEIVYEETVSNTKETLTTHQLEERIRFDIQQLELAGKDLSKYVVVMNYKHYQASNKFVLGLPVEFDEFMNEDLEFIVILKEKYTALKKNKKEELKCMDS